MSSNVPTDKSPTNTAVSAGAAASPPSAPETPAAMSGTAAAADSSSVPAPTTAGGSTDHRDIRPLIEARCLSCHVDGASGPFPLDAWSKLEPYKGLVVNAVKSRRMPPRLADSTNCTETRNDQRLTTEQLALFTGWEAAGFPIGNESDFEPINEEPTLELGPPDKIIKARQAHRLTPRQEYYSCEQVDTRITEDTWVYADGRGAGVRSSCITRSFRSGEARAARSAPPPKISLQL